MSQSRAISANIVLQVVYNGISLSEAFTLIEIPDSDRAFIKEMCYGTLRFWIYLQAFLKPLLNTPLKPEDKDIECLLCVGLYQLLFMDVPEYALVNETVTATRILQKSWASKLVNKILRMGIEKKKENNIKVQGITSQFSHPNWIIDKTKSAFPEHWENILKANNQKAPLFLRINQTQISLEKYIKLLEKNNISYQVVSELSHGIVLENPLPVLKIPGFLEGFFSVQDASGQKVFEYCDIHSDHVVLDACAAPGSKTTHILECVPQLKKLVAVDISEIRLKKIKENIKRLQLPTHNLHTISADICNINAWWDGELFDRILVDAPCSASGVIRRHPDIKILRKKTDIENLSEQQLNILKALWPLLKPTGKLIYSTCSVFPEENDLVIEKFLLLNKNASFIPIQNTWGVTTSYGQQIPTGDRNRDGFYYSVLKSEAHPTG